MQFLSVGGGQSVILPCLSLLLGISAMSSLSRIPIPIKKLMRF
jgi:hypothetical protein